MKRFIFALLAMTVVASSTGCCCIDRLFCWGCQGNCGYGYGNEGPGCGGGCCGGGCGGGGCSSGGCGYGGGGGGGCSDCGSYGGGGPRGGGPAYANGTYAPPPGPVAKRHPAQGHPMVQQRRDANGEYEFAAGPPTGGVTYPYYTNRGPRDFLARNPRSIGP